MDAKIKFAKKCLNQLIDIFSFVIISLWEISLFLSSKSTDKFSQNILFVFCIIIEWSIMSKCKILIKDQIILGKIYIFKPIIYLFFFLFSRKCGTEDKNFKIRFWRKEQWIILFLWHQIYFYYFILLISIEIWNRQNLFVKQNRETLWK